MNEEIKLTQVEESKKLYKSKTLWVNLVMAVAAFIPGVGEWVAGNTEAAGAIVAGINVVLRLVTKEKVSLK
jgi:hypothetical protein